MIVSSALQRISDGRIWTGKRHADAIRAFVKETGERTNYHLFVQGFMTSEGRFVDRKQAFCIAQFHGQLLDPTDPFSYPTLMSEDLW
jgi:hypothetical protein